MYGFPGAEKIVTVLALVGLVLSKGAPGPVHE
jgi:hypothetical protein